MTHWQYRIVENPTPETVIALGAQGWELVAVIHRSIALGETFYFKRQLLPGDQG
jgi:hypothetical protein